MDWTPNFDHEDAYGSYAEFTLPVAVTALNNVMRSTESWDGQAAADAIPAVGDTPAVPAVPAIAPADKPRGGDAIFPAGESWWNLGTGKQEFPLKDVVSYKVHINMPLATALAQGWNLYSWGTTEKRTLLANYSLTTSTTKTVKGKKVTTKKTTKPYAGKIPSADSDGNYGWPFVGEDAYGAYAIIKTARVYSGSVGFIPRRGDSTSPWKVQSGDFKSEFNNGLIAGVVDNYLALGSNENLHSAPAFVGRYGATATFSSGTITVTPVRPSHAAMKGVFPNKIVVTAKKGVTTKTCTIQSSATAAAVGDARWALPATCDLTGISTPAHGDGDATWEIYVQASNGKLVGPGATDKPNAKVVVPEAAS
jgi:hypothetical protein